MKLYWRHSIDEVVSEISCIGEMKIKMRRAMSLPLDIHMYMYRRLAANILHLLDAGSF